MTERKDYSDLLGGLVGTLKGECGVNWDSDPKIRSLIEKWNNYMESIDSSQTIIIPLPFSPEEIDYLNSPFVDDLRKVQNLEIQKAFTTLCRDGHLNTIKWVNSIWEVKYRMPFIYACSRGRLEILEWLYSVDPSLEGEGYTALSTACMNNQLELVRWLTFERKCKINTELAEDIFTRVCRDGTLEMAQLLLKAYPDIRIFTREYEADAFTVAYNFDNRPILRWLVNKLFES